MNEAFSLFPPRASANAAELDALFWWITFVSAVMTALIFFCILYFAVKYRRRSDDERPAPIRGSVRLEIAWSVLPLLVMLTFFVWGTKLYFQSYAPPTSETLDIYVLGKQWMWKVQYPNGVREINELHVPVGKPVKLILASEDVIHSFFIPAFRLKHDVVPGGYQSFWFEATEPGRYRLFCAEYCGTNHSTMEGWVTVMEPSQYEKWLSGGGTGSLVEQGAKMFEQFGCMSCHLNSNRCPPLQGVFGRQEKLRNGGSVLADEAYIRESILNPDAKIVQGYEPGIMPSFQGQISEESLLQLVAYIKSLSTSEGSRP